MRSGYRITPRLAVFLAVAGVAGIGWVARSIRAQDGPKTAPPEGPFASPALTPTDPSSPTPLTDASAPSLPDSTVPPVGVAPAASNPAGSTNDDPEKVAREFVEQNRKVARGKLKDLKDEAEQLRTRLGKVEAGIRRWEVLLAALENSEQPPTARVGSSPPAETPTNLEPVAKTKDPTVVSEAVLPPVTGNPVQPPSSPPAAPLDLPKE